MTKVAQPANPTKTAPSTDLDAFYRTPLGVAVLTDSREGLKPLPTGSVNLIVTSPPYALQFKKTYGNVSKEEYVDWFSSFAREMYRTLTDDGSLVLNIGGSYNKGTPTRSLYHFKLLIHLVEEVGFHLAQECFWHNPAKMPMPAEWVTVRKLRIKDTVEYVFWLSKTPWPKASNQRVLKAGFSPDMHRLARRGIDETTRPSGHKINSTWAEIKSKGSIPSCYLQAPIGDDRLADTAIVMGNNTSNDVYTRKCKEDGIAVHPARFPKALPEFFIKMLTDENDLVLDPFAGSNTTGAVAESLSRRWIAFEKVAEYLEGSRFRFAATSVPKAPVGPTSRTRKHDEARGCESDDVGNAPNLNDDLSYVIR